MLDLTPQSLWEEATEAIEYQKRRTAALDEMIRSYQTPWHVGGADQNGFGRFDSRNHAFEFIALTIAQTVFDNPKWQVTADRGYAADMEAPALQAGLNKWTRDQRLRKILTRLYVDYCFHSCTSMVSLENDIPKLRRIGTRRGFRDHRCFDPEDIRYAGHIYIRDKADLLKDPEWDHGAVMQMAEGAGLKDVREYEDKPNVRDRGEVALIDLWVPEAEVEGVSDEERGNYKGMIYTLPLVGFNGTEKVGKFPREPRAAFCSEHGMYQYGGTYPVPDDIMPLSQLIAVNGQSRQNNDVAKALYEAIVEYKRIIFTSGKDPTLASKVRRARHGSVLPTGLQDVARMIAQMELGGPTPALLTGSQISQETLDRSSGISDAMRGNVTGAATAYENSVAAAGATARQAYPKQQFVDFMGDIGYAAAWLMHTSDGVKIDIPGGQMLGGPPSAHALAIHKQLEQHGVPEDVIEKYIAFADEQHRNTPFNTFGFSVEPLSTERASDPANRARMMAVIPMAMQLMQASVTMPQMNVKEMLGWLGQAFDMPDLARVFDQQIAAQVGAVQMSQGIEQPQTNMQAGSPRMGRDISPKPQSAAPSGFKGAGKPKQGLTTKKAG